MVNQTGSADITSDDKLWALLAYILSPIVPIIILLMADKKDRPFLKAHNIQALIWGLLNYVLGGLLVAVLGLGCLVSLVFWGFAIYWGIKANKGEYVTIPVITDFCKQRGWA